MIDITHQSTIVLDGVEIPVEWIRVLAGAEAAAVRIETSDGIVEEHEIERHDGSAVSFRKIVHPRGNDARPVETRVLAELRDGKGGKQWAFRGSQKHQDLADDGWQERGSTRPASAVPVEVTPPKGKP